MKNNMSITVILRFLSALRDHEHEREYERERERECDFEREINR
jgi:hypothetical protein